VGMNFDLFKERCQSNQPRFYKDFDDNLQTLLNFEMLYRVGHHNEVLVYCLYVTTWSFRAPQAIINGDSTAESSRQTVTPTQQHSPTITEITIDDESSPPAPAVDDKVGEGAQKKTPSLISIDDEKNTESSTKLHHSKPTEGNLISDTKHHSKSLVTSNHEDLKITKADNDTKDNSENRTKSTSPQNKAIPTSDDVTNADAVVENVRNKNNDDDKVTMTVVKAAAGQEKDSNINTAVVEVSDEFSKVTSIRRNDSVSKITTQSVANQPHQQKPPTAEKSISQSSKRNRNLRPDASADLNMQCEYRTMKVFPWLKLNGELNGVLLRRFQEIILAHILLHPGVKQVDVIKQFSVILFPEAIKVLLKFLVTNRSISKHYLVERKVSLFDDPLPNKGFSDQDVYYLPTMPTVLNMTDTNR